MHASYFPKRTTKTATPDLREAYITCQHFPHQKYLACMPVLHTQGTAPLERTPIKPFFVLFSHLFLGLVTPLFAIIKPCTKEVQGLVLCSACFRGLWKVTCVSSASVAKTCWLCWWMMHMFPSREEPPSAFWRGSPPVHTQGSFCMHTSYSPKETCLRSTYAYLRGLVLYNLKP
jgi:hypothetical protein